MEILLLATVTVYDQGAWISRVGVCFLLVPWMGFGNPFFNKRHRVWITVRNCVP